MSDQRRDDGGPAFPAYNKAAHHEGVWHLDGLCGMSLRDYFAGQALAGMLASDAHPDVLVEVIMDTPEKIQHRASFAYRIADALLRERAK
jgi:hypothetical protein